MMFFLPLLVACLIACICTPFVILVYKKLNLLEDPKKNPHPKVVHDRPLPRGGGIVIFVAVFLTTLFFLPIDKHLVGILGGAFFLMLLGIWDDVFSPHPVIRLLLQILAALIVISSGIGIAYITNPFGGIIHLDTPQISIDLFAATHTIWNLSDLLALIWIVWCMNIVNFSKGLDGQMPGYVAISAFVIALLSLRFGGDPAQFIVTNLSLIVSGAFLGFLFFNFYPQRIMSGFGASTQAGFFLAILAILSGGKLATAILVLAVPMIDAGFVILNRLLNKKSPLMGDRSHLHHKLMDLGWGKRRIAVFYWLAAIFLGFLALQLNSEQKLFTMIAIAAVLIGFLLWFRFFFMQFGKSARASG
jgi:UDP-GlcNAc:undecaprenyl-phosphate GlcNAc-1-phosphate transferase